MKEQTKNAALRRLPSISKLLASPEGQESISGHGRGMTTFALRAVIAEARSAAAEHQDDIPSDSELWNQTRHLLRSFSNPKGRRAVNATGIILHTGLGRSPLAKTAVAALEQCAGYTIVEVCPKTGERNRRESRAEQLLQELTGCEAATVVNNCAAAIFLALSATASPGEVIISRGQLVEIGGAFRMPDVMRSSGCVLHEIGTTNRTSLKDYRDAVNERTSAILLVSQSNFRIRGFTETPSINEVCELGKEHGIPVIYDLGGGALVDLERWGFSHETTVREAIAAGVALVCFSGDKLIGGPQAGMICGSRAAVEKARKSSFFRMFRPDKLCLAALEASLAAFLNGTFEQEIPVYQMACTEKETLSERAAEIVSLLHCPKDVRCETIDDLSFLGGGSLPDEALPSVAIRLSLATEDVRKKNRWANTMAKRLRLEQPAVFCRIESSALVLNLRTIFSEEIEQVARTVSKAIGLP